MPLLTNISAQASGALAEAVPKLRPAATPGPLRPEEVRLLFTHHRRDATPEELAHTFRVDVDLVRKALRAASIAPPAAERPGETTDSAK